MDVEDLKQFTPPLFSLSVLQLPLSIRLDIAVGNEELIFFSFYKILKHSRVARRYCGVPYGRLHVSVASIDA